LSAQVWSSSAELEQGAGLLLIAAEALRALIWTLLA
jgi:hypothetical protein